MYHVFPTAWELPASEHMFSIFCLCFVVLFLRVPKAWELPASEHAPLVVFFSGPGNYMSVTLFYAMDHQVLPSPSSTSCLSETISTVHSLPVDQVYCGDITHNKDVLFKDKAMDAHSTAVPTPLTSSAPGPGRSALLTALHRHLLVARQAINTEKSSSTPPWWRWVRKDSVTTAAAPSSAAVHSTLEQRGLSPVADNDRLAPYRGCIDKARQLKKGDVYIGRGARQLGLEKSKWCNPYRVRDHGREQALRLFREHLDATPDLLASVPELQGKRLLCH